MKTKIMNMNIVRLFLIVLPIHFVWVFTFGLIFKVLGFTFSQGVAGSSEFSSSLWLIPWAVLTEEIAFRWLPMIITVAIVNAVAKKSLNFAKIKSNSMLIVLFISSLFFGVMHGNIINMLFLQGVSGLVFSIFYHRAYTRCNPNKNITKWQLIPLGAAVLFHTLSNLLFFFPPLILIPLLGLGIWLLIEKSNASAINKLIKETRKA